MIRIHTSPPSTNYTPGIDFWNDNFADPLMGKMPKFDDLEDHWINLLAYLGEYYFSSQEIDIYLNGFYDPIICLLYLFRENKIDYWDEKDILFINGDKTATIDEDYDLNVNPSGEFFSSLRGKWLF